MAELMHLSTERNSIRDHVARHPIVVFIALAYTITWITWPLNNRFDLGTVNGFGIISLAGPALSAMIVSALLKPEPSATLAGRRWRLFAILSSLALAVMAVVRLWVAADEVSVAGIVLTTAAYPSLVAFLIDVLAAGVVAFIFSGVYSPRSGVRELLHSLNPRSRPVRWYWWATALGLYPFVIVLGNAISAGLGLPGPTSKVTGSWYGLVLDVLIMFPYFLFAGGGLEEPGWRGFALPILQKRYSPLNASLILSVIWAFWHWPMLRGGVLSMIFYVSLVVAPLGILFTIVFNRTGGSLPIAILLHTSINLTEQYLPTSTLAMGIWILLILGLAFWMWRAPQIFLDREEENK
jgi:membrane protease YdiL (CAAX protease family)